MTKRRIDLLPFVARLLAIIKPVHPEIIALVESSLIGQYTFMLHRNSIPILGSRSRVCRFLGELTKFRVIRQGVAFACIKRALDTFERYNVDLVCILMESCGRFLLHQPESSKRIQLVMETMQRKKEAMLTLQSNQIIMIENALYTVNPPPTNLQHIQRETKSLEILFFEQQVLKLSVDQAVPLLRLFPRQTLIEGFVSVWRIPFERLPNLVSMLAALPRSLQVIIVDGLIEQVLLGLENPSIPHQRRLAVCRTLGLLFQSGLLPPDLLPTLIAAMVGWGHDAALPRRQSSPIETDPPGDLFRLKLIVTMAQGNGRLGEDTMALLEYYVAVKLGRNDLSIDNDHILEDLYTGQGLKRPRGLLDLNRAINNLILQDARYAYLVEDVMSFGDEAEAIPSSLPSPARQQDVAFEKELSSLIITSLDSRKYERRISAFDLDLQAVTMAGGAGGRRQQPRVVAVPSTEQQAPTKILLKPKKK